ncbi:MAG: hypothetical protein ACRDK5_10445 [Solirubrobacterales bacterium]
MAFKATLFVRAGDPEGCYPALARLAPLIRQSQHLRADVAASDKAVHRSGVVYVIEEGTSCNRLRLALRAPDGLYTLDSDEGPVQPPGLARKRNVLGGVGDLGKPIVVSKAFRLKGPNETQRLAVNCPGSSATLGGGMISNPPLGSDGEGIYPHSYERLGVQRGWHISATLIDPTPDSTTPRQVRIQAVCATGLIPATPSPHTTVFILPGQTKSATASCPRGQYLFSGGFQRTDFRNFGLPDGGGDYVTESRAIDPRTWRVTGHAFGEFGGELTAIVYCVGHDRPLLREVSASVPLPDGESATATTSPCPGGRQLTSGGFSANGSQDAFFAAGSINRDGTWSATAFAYFGPAPSLTAYGYCIRA